MYKQRDQIEQFTFKSGASVMGPSLNDQQPLLLLDSPNEGAMDDGTAYGEVSIPYVPTPENMSSSWKMARSPIHSGSAPAASRAPEIHVGILLCAMLLGAGLGVLLACFAGANLLSWALIGAAAGGVTTFLIYVLLNGGVWELLPWSIFHHWPW